MYNKNKSLTDDCVCLGWGCRWAGSIIHVGQHAFILLKLRNKKINMTVQHILIFFFTHVTM